MQRWLAAVAHLAALGGAARLRFASVGADGGFTYDYTHRGQDWVQGSCASRQRQSPVNFDDLLSPATGKLSYMYNMVKSPIQVSNNGHTFSADLGGLGYGGITYENAWYNLMNVNVHAKSEHTFRTLHKPVELHLVHKKFDSDALLIVAIPLDSTNAPPGFVQESAWTTRANSSLAAASGKQAPPPAPAPAVGAFANANAYTPPPPGDPNYEPTVQMFLKSALPMINQKVSEAITEIEPIDFNRLYQGGTFFEYAGSLTAPPCAEIVTWFVRREPIMASDLQVHFLHDGIYRMTAEVGNWRTAMPINGRPIGIRQAVKEEPPPKAPEMSIPLGPNPRTDREFRAMKWAKDALNIAKSATDYIKDLDFRLRSAAQAHANALAPNLVPGMVATPPPAVPTQGPSPQDMAKTAENMAKVIADAAKDAIKGAANQISIEARAAAAQAAREATKMVKEGLPPPAAQAPAR